MVKQLALMSFLCLAIHAHATEALETTIKSSDIAFTSEFLNTTTVSANELLRLIDLSQQIINQRKSAWELYAINTRTSPSVNQEKRDILKKLSRIVGIGTLISMAAPFLMVAFYHEVAAKLSTELTDLAIAFSSMMFFFGSIFWLMIVAEERATELKQDYDNAIEVRSLLIKSYNRSSSY